MDCLDQLGMKTTNENIHLVSYQNKFQPNWSMHVHTTAILVSVQTNKVYKGASNEKVQKTNYR
jgi:secreted trypsin-like serine protease